MRPAPASSRIVHRDYDGGVIELPRGGTVLDPAAMPALPARRGHDIVTSDGDDPARRRRQGRHRRDHGRRRLPRRAPRAAARPNCGSPSRPDEEIGLGAALFDVEAFGARCAYTIDGSTLGELQDETFTGVEATIDDRRASTSTPASPPASSSTPPGSPPGSSPSCRADRLSPETTEGREGFIHVYEIERQRGGRRRSERSSATSTTSCSPSTRRSSARDRRARSSRDEPRATVTVESRRNTRTCAVPRAPCPEIVDARRASRPRARASSPTRRRSAAAPTARVLTAMGLPTPNLFTGGHEFHCVREWICVQDMAAAAAVIVHLAGEWARLGTAGAEE